MRRSHSLRHNPIRRAGPAVGPDWRGTAKLGVPGGQLKGIFKGCHISIYLMPGPHFDQLELRPKISADGSELVLQAGSRPDGLNFVGPADIPAGRTSGQSWTIPAFLHKGSETLARGPNLCVCVCMCGGPGERGWRGQTELIRLSTLADNSGVQLRRATLGAD